MHRFISLILPVGKKYLIIFPTSLWLYIVPYRTRLVHWLIVDDKDIEIINKAWSL